MSLTAPTPQVRVAADRLAEISTSIRLPDALEFIGDRRQIRTQLGAGERLSFSWDVRETGPVHGTVEVAVAALAFGTDPYPFRDVVGTQATAILRTAGVPAFEAADTAA